MSTEFLEGSSGDCSRCGKPIANGWASSWPIHCDIIIGRAATLCYPVTGNLLDPRQVKAHPACVKYGAQETRFHWSNADYKGPVAWPICFKCHDEFLTLLGRFLQLRQ